MYPFRSPRFPMQIPYQSQFPPTGPLTRMPMGPMNNPPSGLGGLLSRILGGNRAASPPFQGYSGMGFPSSAMTRMGAGPSSLPGMFGVSPQAGMGTQGLTGILKNSFSSAGGITGMLDNVQRVMGVAQQFGPMIQQYGPFIKNMPAMLKIMKEINSSESESEDTLTTNENSELPEKDLPVFKENNKPKKDEFVTRQSLPKLFI